MRVSWRSVSAHNWSDARAHNLAAPSQRRCRWAGAAQRSLASRAAGPAWSARALLQVGAALLEAREENSTETRDFFPSLLLAWVSSSLFYPDDHDDDDDAAVVADQTTGPASARALYSRSADHSTSRS